MEIDLSLPKDYVNPWAEPFPVPYEQLKTYLAVIPDLENSTRLLVRSVHLENSSKGHKNGWILGGGPLFDESRPTEDGGFFMNGSWMILKERSAAEARNRLYRDVYRIKGTWDFDRAQITPIGGK